MEVYVPVDNAVVDDKYRHICLPADAGVITVSHRSFTFYLRLRER